MKRSHSRMLKKTVVGAFCASAALGAWADDPPIVWGSNMSPWQDGVHGGAYDFKMSSGASKLYSFGINPRVTILDTFSTVRNFGSTTPEYVNQVVPNFVYSGGSFVARKSTKLGGKTLLYIHEGNVYFITPEAPYSSSASTDVETLSRTNYSKKLPLSNFTGLETASTVHMNLRSLLWLNGSTLYSGGDAKDTSSGTSTVVSSTITEARSFGPFLFVADTAGKVYFVGDNAQNKLILIPGASSLAFLSNRETAYMVDSDTIQLAGIGTSNYRFKYTDGTIANEAVQTVSSNHTASVMGEYLHAHAASYTNGKPSYYGTNQPGAWVLNGSGGAVFTQDAYGTNPNGIARSYTYVCIDKSGWPTKATSFNNLSAVYAALPYVAASHLGGYGDLSVAMLTDGTLRFAGSHSATEVLASDFKNGKSIINWWGWPYPEQTLGFCDPTELTLDESQGPKNVRATKALYNDKVEVAWDAGLPGSDYTVRRIANGVTTIVATNTTGTTFTDTSTTGGGSKTDAAQYSVSSNAATPIFKTRAGAVYIEPGVNFSGCNGSSSVGSDCVGFRANAPTAGASNLKAVVITDVNSQVISTSGFSVADPDSPYDSHTFALVPGSANMGDVTTNASGQIVYTPPSGYVGLASFMVNATDKAGNSLQIPVEVDIQCSKPAITLSTLPTSFNTYISQQGSVKFDANACNQAIGMTVKVKRRGSSAELTDFTQTFTGVTTGAAQVKNFFLNNLTEGEYTLYVDIASERAGLAATNKASSTVDFKVNGVGTYTLAPTKTLYSEDEIVTANVTGGSCTLESDSVARGNGNCFVQWGTNPFYQVTTTGVKSISGYAAIGALQAVNAKIFKYDSAFVAHEVASITTDVSVNAGIPTALKPITVPASSTAYLDSVKAVFERESGYDCTIYTSSATATAAVTGGQKACLLEATLPDGFTWMAGQANPTIIGRFSDGASPKVIPYKLSKVYAGKSPVEMVNSSLSFNTTAPSLVYDISANRSEYVANGTTATIDAKITAGFLGGKTCAPTNSLATAQSTFSGQNALSCLVEWNTIPSGLAVDATAIGAVPRLKGVPLVIGDNDIKYSVYAVKTVGGVALKEKLAEYAGTIKVTDITGMNYSLGTPKSGTMRLAGEATDRVLVGDSGEIGEVTVIAGDFSTVKMTVQETGYAPQVFTGLRNGDKKMITISSGAKGAWLNRKVTIKFDYEEVLVSTTTSYDIDLLQLPAQKMAIQIAQPGVSPNDSQPFSFTAKMGVPVAGGSLTYAAASGGAWKAALFVKDGLLWRPVTTEATVDASGNVTWTGLNYADFVGIDFWAKAYYVAPEGSNSAVQPQEIVSDKSIKLNFVLGGALSGQTTLGKAKGVVPLRQTYDVTLTPAQAASLKSVSWQISKDNVAWDYIGVAGRVAPHTLTEGGVYYVRGEMTNKYTDIVSYSEPATFTATQVYKINFTGNDLYLPGADANLSVALANYDDTPTDATSVDIVWSVQSSRGGTNTTRDVTSLVLNSPLASTYDVTVRVKGKGMDAANPESWYEIKRRVVFGLPSSPRANIVGPRSVEVGNPGVFSVTVKPTWAAGTKTNLAIKGKWVLPDGVTEVLGSSDLTHIVRSEDGVQQKVLYKSWIEGAEAETTVTTEYKYTTNTYVFPTFKLSATTDSMYAPAFLKIGVIPETSFDAVQVRGKKLTYTWTVPDGFEGKASGYALRGIADAPGTYKFDVVISDDRGNTQTLSYELVLETTLPWNLTMKLQPALKMNRNPMLYVIKPSITGGHPKDRIKESVVSINGVAQPTVQGLAKSVTIPTAGDSVVMLRVLSSMGMTAETSVTATVNQNVAPVCTLDVAWDRAKTSARVGPRCTDTDGKIKRIVWYIDGVALTRNNNYTIITTTEDKPSSDVRVEIFDDSGAKTELTQTVSRNN